MARMRLLLAAILCLAVQPGNSDAAGPSVIFLQGGRDSTFRDSRRNYQGLLARELVRQALLCAAREELGCATHDLHLGQPAPEKSLHLDVVAVLAKDDQDATQTQLEIRKGELDQQELVVVEPFKTKVPLELTDVVRLAEARSRGNFVKHLQQVGVVGQPREWNKASKPGADVTRALAEMNFISQFRAAAALHAQIEKEGRSAPLVSALTRAYANLAILTEHHWSGAHKVFAARSLIYSQRLVAGKHDNTLAFTARAYARALAGLHAEALEDLDELDKLAEAGKAKPDELAKILRSYCLFRLDELDPARCQPENAELVRLLRLLAREHGGSSRQTLDEALAVTQALPHCYRAHHTLGLRSGVSLGHVVTVQGIVDTGRTLYSKLSGFTELPADLQAAIPREALAVRLRGGALDPNKELPGRAKLIAAFKANESTVGQQGQLTWPVLAQLMAEHSFLEVYIRTRFEKRILAFPPDEFLTLATPLYALHPMAAVLDSFRSDQNLVRRAIERAASIDLDTLEMQADELSLVRPAVASAEAQRRQQQVRTAAATHLDHTASDLLRRYVVLTPERGKVETAIAYRISPHAPAIRNHMVVHHWDVVEPQLEGWLKAADRDASQLAALGVHFRDEKEWKRATELFSKARDLSPEFTHIRLLADAYRAQGYIVKWRSTLEEILKQTDYALEHARVRVDIADEYMSRRDFQKALPYAQEAAETYAGWALLKAAQCFEGLQHWNEAENMYRATSERYDNVEWIAFVRRTGQGSLPAARDFSRGFLSRQNGAGASAAQRFFILKTIGNDEAARANLEEAFDAQPTPLLGLHLAMLLEETKQNDERDAVLAKMAPAPEGEAPKPPRVGVAALVDVIRQDLAAGGKAAFEVQEVLKLKTGAPATEFAAFDYLLGKYLQQHGKAAVAKQVWLERMTKNQMNDIHRTFCGVALLAVGVGPAEYKAALQKAIPEPAPPKEAPPKDAPK